MKIFLSGKCSDMCSVLIVDEKGNTLKKYDGYVPVCIPNQWGDYIHLEIDAETGLILNWPSIEVIKNWIEKGDSDE